MVRVNRLPAMRVRPPTAIVALVLVIGLLAVAFPRPTMACSCAMSERPMRDAAKDGSVSVFAGITGPLQAIGVPIQITRWFQGPVPPGGVAVLDPQPFNADGAGCGTNPPAIGKEWIFLAGRNDVGRYVVGLCSTYAAVDTDDGRALLADAITVFGPGGVPETVAASPTPPTSPEGDPAGLVSTIVPVAIAILFATGLLAGLFVILGPRRPR